HYGDASVTICTCHDSCTLSSVSPRHNPLSFPTRRSSDLDALRETQGLEAGERLRSGQRGRFSPAELITALTESGARSLDLPVGSDRKSTRLNSSHVSSSYAVFCLKKTPQGMQLTSGHS